MCGRYREVVSLRKEPRAKKRQAAGDRSKNLTDAEAAANMHHNNRVPDALLRYVREPLPPLPRGEAEEARAIYESWHDSSTVLPKEYMYNAISAAAQTSQVKKYAAPAHAQNHRQPICRPVVCAPVSRLYSALAPVPSGSEDRQGRLLDFGYRFEFTINPDPPYFALQSFCICIFTTHWCGAVH